MSAFSAYLSEKLLAHIFLGNVYSPPDEIYISLHTEELDRAGVGAEVQGASYERKLIQCDTSKNINTIVWNNLPQTTIVAVGLWDQDGNFLMRGTLPSSEPKSAGDSFTLNVGDITIGLS